MSTHKKMTIALGIAALCLAGVSANAKPHMKHLSLAGLSEGTKIVQGEEGMLVAENEAAPLTAAEMDKLRGGYFDASGMIYRFAVNVHTALNGAQIFSHSMVLEPTGPHGQLQSVSSGGLIPQNIPSNVTANVVGNNSGVVVTDHSGGTMTILNQTAAGIPSSIIYNTANNNNISQTVNVSLTLQSLPTIMNLVHISNPGGAIAQHAALHSLGF